MATVMWPCLRRLGGRAPGSMINLRMCFKTWTRSASWLDGFLHQEMPGEYIPLFHR
jgi:hypothetical protein